MKNSFWLQFMPFMNWLPKVNRESVRSDFIAGLTGAVIVLPQGVAFASIAGMPPEYGLYAAMIPAIISALFGSSWHLVSGPTTAASIVMFSSLSAMHSSITGAPVEPGSAEYISLAVTLTMMVGLIQLAMGFARLGTLVNFISHSVVIGFTAGAAILIATSQIKNFLGLSIPRGLEFIEVWHEAFMKINEVNPYVLSVGVLTIVVGLAVKKFMPKMPYMVVAMLAATGLSMYLNFRFGQDVTGIKTAGQIPGSLPPISQPSFSLDVIKQLAPATVAVTLLALTEAVSIARSIASKSGQHIDGNQEFIGQGLSNFIGSFFSSYVATGSFNRSGVNYEAGAKTPMAAMFAGFMLMGLVVVVGPYAQYLPNAAMAGILLMVAYNLIDFHHIAVISKASRSEAAILGVTFFSTLFLELEFAIILGVVLSLVVYLSKTSRPRLYPRVPDPSLPNRRFNSNPNLPECPQLKIVRLDGSLFFGAISYVSEKFASFIAEKPEQKHLLLLAQGVNFLDVAGAELLVKETKRYRNMGGNLWFYRLKPGVLEVMEHGKFNQELDNPPNFRTKDEAIKHIFPILDKSICAKCDKRIFNECKSVPKES